MVEEVFHVGVQAFEVALGVGGQVGAARSCLAVGFQAVVSEPGGEPNGSTLNQVERCKIILSFPAEYQKMSMEPDPKERIPSNFWVELYPVLEKMESVLPGLVADEGRWGITDRLVDKYKKKRIKSVIHFRRVLEAFDMQDEPEGVEEVADKLREYVLDPELETRTAFDGFILDPRRLQRAAQAADKFIRDVRSAKIDHLTEGKDELILKLTGVKIFVEELLAKLEGEDPPPEGGD